MPPAPERCSYRLLSTLNPSETPSVIAVFVAPDSGPWRRSVGVAAEVGGPDRGRIPGRHRVSALDNSCSAGLAGSVRPAFGIRSARTQRRPRQGGSPAGGRRGRLLDGRRGWRLFLFSLGLAEFGLVNGEQASPIDVLWRHAYRE